MPEPTDDDNDLDALVEAAVQKRLDEADKQRNRGKQPKDFGEFLDRVSDAVIDRIEQRGNERRKAADDADQEPERGGGEQSGFAKWWSGGK